MAPKLLVSRDFRRLWSGKVVSQLGDKVYALALAWWMLDRTGSMALMGVMMALSVLPGIVLGFFVGPLLDRWDKRGILVCADLARALIVGAAAFLEAEGALEPWMLLVSAVAVSLASAFFDPTAQAVIPRIAPGPDLPRANALNQFSAGLAMVAGPVIGALGVIRVGYALVFVANAASYAFSAAMEGLIDLGPAPASGGGKPFFAELREGFAFVRGSPGLPRIIAAVALAHFFVGALLVCQPAMARGMGGAGIGALGFLQCAAGGGTILGAVLVGRRRGEGRRGEAGLYLRMCFLGVSFAGLAVALAAAPGSVVAPAILTASYGYLLSQSGALWSTLLQERVPPRLAGRVFGLSALAGNASMPLAYAVVGVLAGSVPLPAVLGVGGAILLAASAGLLARVPTRV